VNAGNVIEAWSPGGVRLTNGLSDRHESGTLVDLYSFVEPLTRMEFLQMADFATAQLGKDYDWRGVLKFVTKRKGKEDWSKWWCSELAFETFEAGNRQPLARTEGWEVPPDWLPRSPLFRYSNTVVTK
jgi:uncharacterized protein YycO